MLFVSSCAAAAAGQKVTGAEDIYYWHDDAHDVSCWSFDSGSYAGVSCIPDKDL